MSYNQVIFFLSAENCIVQLETGIRSKRLVFSLLVEITILCSTSSIIDYPYIVQVRRDCKAIVRVETEDLNQMPIVDFAPGEFLTSNEFGFEVGPICFS